MLFVAETVGNARPTELAATGHAASHAAVSAGPSFAHRFTNLSPRPSLRKV
jgi:hypothetical protein